MDDLISRQAAIDALAKFVPYVICDESTESYTNGLTDAYNLICQLPSAQPERKKDIIQNFHDYQIEWLKSHNDIELEPDIENLIIHFLHDTANCYMIEMDM